MNGRDDTTIFLPLDFRICGQRRDSCPTIGQYLTRDQARYVYKKVETGEMINMDMIQQEIEQEKQLDRMDNRNREINQYRELIVNNTEKTEPPMMQMEQWSILSNVLNCVQHSKFNSMNHILFIIPSIVEIHGHRFKIYTLVSEIHENEDLGLGIKNVFELEGVINSRDC